MDLTFRQLEIFIAIVKNKSIKKASEKLYLSQSAVSMSLSDMERRLGAKLFDRVSKRLVLNDFGEQVYISALYILKKFEDLVAISRKNELYGNLKIGATQTIGNYVLPYILGEFKSKNQDIDMTLFVENTEQIMEKLINFEIDLAFIEGIVLSKEVENIPWIEDEIIIFSSAQYPLADKKEITFEDLEKEKWILREKGSGTRDIFERFMYGKVKSLNIYLEIGHTEAIKKIVETGIGVGSLSALTLKREMEAGLLKKINFPYNIKRNFQIVIHKKRYKSKLIKEFINFSREYF